MASKEAAEETVSFESAADLRRWFEERRTRSQPKTRETVPAPTVLTETPSGKVGATQPILLVAATEPRRMQEKSTLVASTEEKKAATEPQLPEVTQELVAILKPGTIFQNWAKTVTETVLEGRPRTVEDVVAIVNFARERNLKVRAVGKTHSFTPIYSDHNQILLFLDQLTLQESGKRFIFNSETMEVTFSAGVSVKEAREFMKENNIYFESHTIIQEVHMLGITPTGSHGTGWNQSSISDWITKMKIVKSDGQIEEVSDKDKLSAAGISLGLFGVIVEQTMRVWPMQKVKVTNDFSKTFAEVFGPDSPYLPHLYKRDFSLEFFWFPYNSMTETQMEKFLVLGNTGDWDPNNDIVWIRRVELIPADKAAEEDFSKDLPDEKTDEEVKDLFYGAAFPLFKGAQFVAKLPGFKGLLNRFGPVIASMSFNKVIKPSFINMNKFTVRPIDSAIHFVDPYLSPFRVYDFEMAFDCPADCTAVLKATQSVRDILKKEAKKGKYPLPGTFEMRFIGSSNCLLSPSVVCQNHSGHSAYLELVPFSFAEDYEEFFSEVAIEWIKIGAEVGCMPVPHWGKGFETIPDHRQYIREVFGKRIELFKAKRAEMNVDPTNMFVTEELKEIFQL